MSNTCAVLLTNDSYFNKLLYTLNGVLRFGYTGDICIVIGDDLVGSEKLSHPLLQHNRIHIKHFPDIVFSSDFLAKFSTINRDEHWRKKTFQYHKLHLFNAFFKKWDYIFYLDAGVTVLNSIDPIISLKEPGTLLAHSDAYPDYVWKLKTQFIQDDDSYNNLVSKFDLEVDYPQTTIMLYDTNIINDSTYSDLLSLAEDVKISKTNDQGIIALYFASIKRIWKQIQLGDDATWYYDYAVRPNKQNKPHILLKEI